MHDFFATFTDGVVGTPRHHIYPTIIGGECIDGKMIGGKWRLVYAPNDSMREVQQNVLTFLRPLAPRFVSSSSKKKGRGAVRNARRYMQGGHLFKLDITKAFPSTDAVRMMPEIAKAAAKKLGPSAPSPEEWFEFLHTCALSKHGGLAEGTVVSSFLFDWYCEVFIDRRLREFCTPASIFNEEERIVFTRYADDLTFFSACRVGIRRRSALYTIIKDAGFTPNYSKTQVVRLHRSVVPVTGPQRGGYRKIGVSRAWLKETEWMLYQALTAGLLFAPQGPAVVRGRVQYLLDVLRGRRTKLTSLEQKVLKQYVQYCTEYEGDASWAKATVSRLAYTE